MSAEIFILSGARAGERIVLDTPEFRVGSQANCEVFFDPKHDVPAKGRLALFRLTDDGWSVSSTGIGDLLVNQTVVSGRTRIRSGDVLRMSDEGPAFSFSILTRAAAAAPSPSPGRQPAWRTSPLATAPVEARASPRPMLADGPAIPTPAPAVAAATATATQPGSAPTGKKRLVLWASAIGGGLAIVVVLACVAAYVMTPPPAPPAPPPAQTPYKPHNLPPSPIRPPNKSHVLPKAGP